MTDDPPNQPIARYADRLSVRIDTYEKQIAEFKEQLSEDPLAAFEYRGDRTIENVARLATTQWLRNMLTDPIWNAAKPHECNELIRGVQFMLVWRARDNAGNPSTNQCSNVYASMIVKASLDLAHELGSLIQPTQS